jgi:hypothetical protein
MPVRTFWREGFNRSHEGFDTKLIQQNAAGKRQFPDVRWWLFIEAAA